MTEAEYDPDHPVLAAIRDWIPSLPEAVELETWGHPTFRAGKKIFAIFAEDQGEPVLNVKQKPEQQEVHLRDMRFYFPPYTGHKGWVGVRVDEVEWDELEALLLDAYRQVALKRMLKALDGEA
ncbi:MAG: MmcQ/YjbR family DNA-binding protein [Planctomycetota bacterium]|jgi:predicted DNA-binding protein (MmcQ/YjbR family)